MNRSAMENLGLPSATDRPRSQPPDKEGVESRVLAMDFDCLTGEPLELCAAAMLLGLLVGQGAMPGSYDAALDGVKESLQAPFSDPGRDV